MSEQRRPHLWVDPENDPRHDTHVTISATGIDAAVVGEKATLQEYLTRYRLTLGMKCDGLTPQQLATRSVPPSTMSLLGLIRHMAAVEHSWFQRKLQQRQIPRLFGKDGADRDGDFNGAVGNQECVDEAFAAWREQIALAERGSPRCRSPTSVARWRSRMARPPASATPSCT